jgi:thiamine monophosphate synthase
VFPTTTKDSRVIGFEGIAAVCNTPGTPPVVAIGGLGLSSAEPCIAAGAAGIAVVTAIFGQQDAVKATQELRAAVDAALAKHKK